MRRVVFIVGCAMIGIIGWSEEAFIDNFYGMAMSLEDARSTSLESRDVWALKKSGVYYFALVNGVNSVRIDKRHKAENAKMALDYLEAAYGLDSQAPAIMIWRATANLAYAGVSKKLANKIKYSNLGISYFNQIPMKHRNNLDYLFMRMISYSQVPKGFKNLTKIVKNDALKFLQLYESLSFPRAYATLKESVKVLHAYAYFISRDRKKAKNLMLSVDEDLLLVGQAADTTTAEYYFTMKKKLRIK